MSHRRIRPKSDRPPPSHVFQPGYGKVGEIPLCPKNHRFRPISFDESTGIAIYACKCGIQYERQAKFICTSGDDE